MKSVTQLGCSFGRCQYSVHEEDNCVENNCRLFRHQLSQTSRVGLRMLRGSRLTFGQF